MTAAKLSIRGDWKSVEAEFHLVRGLALRSWRQFFASFAVKKNLTAKNAKDSQRTQSKSLGQGANGATTGLGNSFIKSSSFFMIDFVLGGRSGIRNRGLRK